MRHRVDRQDLPFEETSRRPRGLRKDIVGGLGRLYRHAVAIADIAEDTEESLNLGLSTTGP